MKLVEKAVWECAEPLGNAHNSVTLQVPQKQQYIQAKEMYLWMLSVHRIVDSKIVTMVDLG